MTSNPPLDRLAASLLRLRARAGNPSYADIAVRVARLRVERGADPVFARPAKTTVYDAFRTGRSRVDVDLVADIVAALGADEAERREFDQAITSALAGATPAAEAPDTFLGTSLVVDDPAHAFPLPARVALIVAGVVLNIVGSEVSDLLSLQLFLDMIGTAAVAIAIGPWAGVITGAATNLGQGLVLWDWTNIPFGLVNVLGAVLWGYGVRRWHMARSVPRFFVWNLIVAAACSSVAQPIVMLVFGDVVHLQHGEFELSKDLGALSLDWLKAVFTLNLTAWLDKVLAGFTGLALAGAAHSRIPAQRARGGESAPA